MDAAREEYTPLRKSAKKYYNRVKREFTGETAREFFNTDKLLALLDEHKAGKKDNSRRVWTVYTFLVWYKEFFINR